MEKFLILSCWSQEILILITQTKKSISSCQILLWKLNHAIALIFKFLMQIINIFYIDFLWWSKCITSCYESIWIRDEIFELFFTFECINFAIEKCNILIIFNADLNIFSPYLIADWTEIKIFWNIIQYAVRTESNMCHIWSRMRD